jgi:hypothetical protein
MVFNATFNYISTISLGSNGDIRSFVLHFLITYSVCSLYLYIFIGHFVIVTLAQEKLMSFIQVCE